MDPGSDLPLFQEKTLAALRRAAERCKGELGRVGNDPLRVADLLWKRSRRDTALREDLVRSACFLLASAAIIEVAVEAPVAVPRRRRTMLERDPEVAAFIRSQLGTVGVEAIAALCRKRFGPRRSPGKSTIGRYWLQLRYAAVS